MISVWCEEGIVFGRLEEFEVKDIRVMFFGLIFGSFKLIWWEYNFVIVYVDDICLFG